MSTINTNTIDANYPVPGKNNSSQGFRDNFTSIKNNLNIAATEISDLQNKAILKQALTNTTLNNDMGGTQISNAATLGFRATGHALGNDLSGNVSIDLSLGDVHYGTIAADSTVNLVFYNWASYPANAQSNVQVLLTVNDSNSFVSLQYANIDATVTTLQNYDYDSGNFLVSAPYGVNELYYRFSSVDCGATVTVEPYNIPRTSNQITTRTPTNVGQQGDVQGAVCADTSYLYVCTAPYDGATHIWKRITLNAF